MWVGLGYGYGDHIKTHFRQDLGQDKGHTEALSDDGGTYDEAGDGFLDENTSATDAENDPLEGSPLTAAAHLNVLWEAGMLDVEHFLRYDGWGRQGQLIANDIDLPARFLTASAGTKCNTSGHCRANVRFVFRRAGPGQARFCNIGWNHYRGR